MTPIKFIETLSLGLPILSTKIDFEDSKIINLIKFSNNPKFHVENINNFKKFEKFEQKLLRQKAVKDRNWNIIMKKYYEIIF